MPNYNSTLQTNNSSLEEIITQLNNMPDAGGSANPILQDKTVTPTTSKQTITADSGYDGLDTVTVNAMPTATQATPSVTINSSTGLVTATATQSAGYVTAGTKSGTLQLAFKAAQTITPTTTNQTIAANTYLGGVQTIKGDANLVASNIVSGKSIFGVVGTATTGSSGGDTSVEDSLITRTISTYTNDRVTYIGSSAFYCCTSLTSVNFPKVLRIHESAFYYCTSLASVSFPLATSIGNFAFNGCRSLTSVNFPQVISIKSYAFWQCTSLASVSFPLATSISSNAFDGCRSLTSVSFPQVISIGSSAFNSCTKLTSVSFPKVISIKSYAFLGCTSLSAIYLMASSVCTLANSNAFSNTGIWSNKGSIFVPSSLVASYKAATNWTFFSNRIYSS